MRPATASIAPPPTPGVKTGAVVGADRAADHRAHDDRQPVLRRRYHVAVRHPPADGEAHRPPGGHGRKNVTEARRAEFQSSRVLPQVGGGISPRRSFVVLRSHARGLTTKGLVAPAAPGSVSPPGTNENGPGEGAPRHKRHVVSPLKPGCRIEGQARRTNAATVPYSPEAESEVLMRGRFLERTLCYA